MKRKFSKLGYFRKDAGQTIADTTYVIHTPRRNIIFDTLATAANEVLVAKMCEYAWFLAPNTRSWLEHEPTITLVGDGVELGTFTLEVEMVPQIKCIQTWGAEV